MPPPSPSERNGKSRWIQSSHYAIIIFPSTQSKQQDFDHSPKKEIAASFWNFWMKVRIKSLQHASLCSSKIWPVEPERRGRRSGRKSLVKTRSASLATCSGVAAYYICKLMVWRGWRFLVPTVVSSPNKRYFVQMQATVSEKGIVFLIDRTWLETWSWRNWQQELQFTTFPAWAFDLQQGLWRPGQITSIPSPIMQPPEPQLLTDLRCQVNWLGQSWMYIHGWRIDTSSGRRENKIMAMCSHITGKSRMTNDEDFRDGKSFRGGHLAITYRDGDKRTNLDGRRYRDRFRPFFLWLALAKFCGMGVGQGGTRGSLLHLHPWYSRPFQLTQFCRTVPQLETVQSMVPDPPPRACGQWCGMHAAGLQRGGFSKAGQVWKIEIGIRSEPQQLPVSQE